MGHHGCDSDGDDRNAEIRAAERRLRAAAQAEERSQNRKDLEERLRRIEWSATSLLTRTERQGCRCGGNCEQCREIKRHRQAVHPREILELVNSVKEFLAGEGASS